MGLGKSSQYGCTPFWPRVFKQGAATAPSGPSAQDARECTSMINLYILFIVEASPLVTLAGWPEVKKTRKQRNDSSGQD